MYSYIRFSTPEQKLGDSERRQLAEVKAFAEKRGLVLDETLKDEGLSGYHGAHRTRGALGRFLAAVRRGKVPSGSVLVVEKISRLGREDVVTSLRTILTDLVENGIVLQTLHPEETYDRASVNGPAFLGLWISIQQAHKESSEKSYFTAKTWEARIEKARIDRKPVTSVCPSWLKVIKATKAKPGKTSSFEVIPEAAQKGDGFLQDRPSNRC